MTGYGGASGFSGDISITVEVKSVNNRFLDSSVRLPRIYTFAEESVKALVQQHISRGKVDVFITIDISRANDVAIKINKPLAEAYIGAFKEINSEYGLENDLSATTLSKFPDVFIVEKKEIDSEKFTADLCSVVSDALDAFDAMRANEGEKLKTDIFEKLNEIKRMADFIAERSPQTVAEYRLRLEQKMSELLSSTDIDKARLVTEAAIFADKVAVDEELTRLDSHIAQMRDMLNSGGVVGRKLDFLIQEFNREVNTTGSKCNDLEITKRVVDMKSEIEKIREQIQNLE
jgi:uncharacterized protein (TIGR00255 family)